MSQRFLSSLLLLVSVLSLVSHAQELSLYNIDASGFPRITANYMAFDDVGQPYEQLTARDFRITESTVEGNTSDRTATLQHDCVDLSTTTSVSLVLIVDESFSMDERLPSGIRRLDYVKSALTRLVTSLDWNGETAVSIIGFSGRSRLLCDWQTRPEPVLAAIGRLTPLGATNYEAPFINPPQVFELMESRPPSIPKVTIFLTDGFPNPEIADRPRFEQRVIQQARQQGIRIYSVTLMIGRTDRSIFEICRATGGRSIVADETSLVDLMSVLAFETTRRRVCTISWISPMVCTDAERQRSATVRLMRGRQPTTIVSYQTPASAVYSITVTPQPLIFDDVPPRERSTATITVTAHNTELQLTSASITTPEFFTLTDFRPTTIPIGGSATFTVAFTQGAERRTRQAAITFTGTPFCVPPVTVIGGGGAVVLTSPNGGEVISSCASTLITWSGVGPEQPVRLEFSCDDVNWQIIADTVFGSSYEWLPDEGCETGRIRVSTIPGERLLWAYRYGGAGSERTTGVAAAPDGQRIFLGGSFTGQTTIGTFSANAALRGRAGFLATLDGDGEVLDVRFLRGTSGTNSEITAVRTDRDGNVIIGGQSSSPRITYGPWSWDAGPIDQNTAFIAKYARDGRQLWRYVLRGTTARSADITLDALVIRPMPDGSEEVVAYGRAENIISIATAAEIVEAEMQLPLNSTWFYTLRIDQAGPARLTTQAQSAMLPIPNPLQADDNQGYRYRAGDFDGNVLIPLLPPVTLTSTGLRDCWVARSAVGIPTNDLSDRTFRITRPLLVANQSKITFVPTATDRTVTFNDARGLRNAGTEPLMIDSVRITGPHADDFRLVGTLDSLQMNPGESVSLELVFQPSGEGPRIAALEVYASCRNTLVIDLEGEGRPECPWDLRDTIDLGRIVLGTATTQRFDCILRSNRRILMRADIRLRGSSDFSISPQGPVTMRFNQCITLDVTFRPTSVGRQVAQIDMNLPVECGVAFVTVLADVVQADLSAHDHDFGNRRLGTTTNAAVDVVNNGTIAVDIDAITPVDAGVTPLVFTLPALPLRLEVGDTLRIPVAYTPTERIISVSRLAIRGRGVDSVRIATVRGAGYQPTLDAQGYTFQPVLVGTPSAERGVVRLRNTDAQWPLTIADVHLAVPSQHFAWESAIEVPFVIPPNDVVDIPVRFHPQLAGRLAVDVRIMHDGRPGPDPIPPYATTTVVISGVGLQRSVLPPVDMGALAWCTTADTTILLTNDMPNEPLVISDVVSTGDAQHFQIEPPPPYTIPAGGSMPVRIVFQPSEDGSFAAAFAYQNSRQLDLTINLTGRSVSLPTATTVAVPARVGVGDLADVDIDITLPTTFNVDVDALLITISHPERVVRYRGTGPSLQPGWIIQPISRQGASTTLRADRMLGTAATPLIRVALQYEVFLAPVDTFAFDVVVAAEPRCVLPSQARALSRLDLGCADTKRVVDLGAVPFEMSPPVYTLNESVITYLGIGIPCQARLNVVDVQGRLVTSWGSELSAGYHHVKVPLPPLPAGWYGIDVECGPFRQQRPFLVVD